MPLLTIINLFLKHIATNGFSKQTIARYRRDLLLFDKFLGKRANGPVFLEEITTNDIEAFLAFLLNTLKRAPNSRANAHYTLRALWNYCCKKDLVPRNVAAMVDSIKLPKKERVYITFEEALLVVDAILNRLIALVAFFLLNSGLRISECLALTLNDVDLDKRVIHVLNGKGAKDRNVPINDTLHAKLLDFVQNWRADGDSFFATKRTKKLSYPHVNDTIRKAAVRAGLKVTVTCHTFRHCFASSLIRRNVNVVEVSKLLGHADLAVTSIYTHADLGQLASAVSHLNASGPMVSRL